MGIMLKDFIDQQFAAAIDIPSDEITSEVGARFSYPGILARLNSVYLEIATRLSLLQYHRLLDDYEFSMQPDAGAISMRVDLPERVCKLIALDKINSDGAVTEPIWYFENGQGYYRCDSQSDTYEIQHRSIVVRSTKAADFRLRYVRTPGRLCYGTITLGSSNTELILTPTVGALSQTVDAYVGDYIGFQQGTFVETIRITAFDPSTRVVTLESAPSMTLVNDDEFSIQPFIAEQYLEMLADFTAGRYSDDISEGVAAQVRAERQFDQMLQIIAPVETRSGGSVRQVTPGLGLPGGYGMYGPWGRDYV